MSDTENDAAPADPKAPPSRRPGWGDSAPQTAPPMPFTEWPYGGSTNLGVTRPSSADSPARCSSAICFRIDFKPYFKIVCASDVNTDDASA